MSGLALSFRPLSHDGLPLLDEWLHDHTTS